MPKIKFKGKEYDSLADMPAKTRRNYFKAQAGYDIPEQAPEKSKMMPVGIETMPEEVQEIYERVRGKLDAKPMKSSRIDELPKVEDLYRQSVPAGMQNQPSDEIIYKASPPIIANTPPIVESDHTTRRLLVWLGLALLLAGVALAFYFGIL